MLGEVLGVRFLGKTYDEKVKLLILKKIGLWDVYHSAIRQGSMDSNFGEKVLNDFGKLKKSIPNIRLICFNGKEAGLSEQIIASKGFKTTVLPSSSGANRRDQIGKLNAWKVIKDVIT